MLGDCVSHPLSAAQLFLVSKFCILVIKLPFKQDQETEEFLSHGFFKI